MHSLKIVSFIFFIFLTTATYSQIGQNGTATSLNPGLSTLDTFKIVERSIPQTTANIIDQQLSDYKVYDFIDYNNFFNFIDNNDYVRSFILEFSNISEPTFYLRFDLYPNNLLSPDFYSEYNDSSGLKDDTLTKDFRCFYKGKFNNEKSNIVRLTIHKNLFTGFYRDPDHDNLMYPIRFIDTSYDSSYFVYYQNTDVILEDPAEWCGWNEEDMGDIYGEPYEVESECKQSRIEFAIESDYEFYLYWTANKTHPNLRILSIMNQVEGVYVYDLNISFQINYMHFWSDENDGYTGDLYHKFTQFENLDPFASISKDINHIFIIEDIPTAYRGRASNEICTTSVFSVTENTHEESYRQVVITAHEIGHNLAAVHYKKPDPQCDGNGPLMCWWVQHGALRFGSKTINTIEDHINNNGYCLNISQTPSFNNGWEKNWTNDARTNYISGWHIKDDDRFLSGDLENDQLDELLCIANEDWAMVIEYNQCNWDILWHNNGNALIGDWYIQPGDKYYISDFNGDGKDDLLCISKLDHGAMLLEFNGSSWSTIWSNGYNGFIGNWPLANSDSYVPGDLNGSGKSELLCIGQPNNSLAEVLSFDPGANSWNMLWTNGGNGMLAGWNLDQSDVYVSVNIMNNYNNNPRDEILITNYKHNDYPELFSFENSYWASL